MKPLQPVVSNIGRPVEPEAVADEPSGWADLGGRLSRLADDLPFAPRGAYEPRWLQLTWRAGLLAVLAFAAAWPGVGETWLWRDERVIAADTALWTTRGIGAVWAEPLAGAPPGVRTFWWALVRAFGVSPFWFKGAGLLLHSGVCVAAWLAMRRLGVGGAWLAAAVFAVHPIVLPNVAWPTRQGEILGVLAAVVGNWCVLRARRFRPADDVQAWTDPAFEDAEDEHARYWGTWALFTAAVVVGSAVGSPAGLVAAAGLWGLGHQRPAVRSGVFGAVVLAWAVLSLAGWGLFTVVPLWRGGATSGRLWGGVADAMPWTVWQALVPTEVPFAFERSGIEAGGLALTAAVTLACLGLPIVRRSAACLALSAAALLSVLHGLPRVRDGTSVVLVADLAPYGSALLLVLAGVAWALRQTRRYTGERTGRAVRWALGVQAVAIFGVLTYWQAATYRGTDALWQATLALDPESRLARSELADSYLAEGFFEESGTLLDRVADAERDAAWSLARARVFAAQKRPGDAVAMYEAANRQRPYDPPTVMTLAEAYATAGDVGRAARLYDDLLSRVPPDAGLLTNAGLAKSRIGDAQGAAGDYEKALTLDPRYVPAHLNLANVLFELGQYKESSRHLQEVVRLDPRNFAAFVNAGVLLYRLGDPGKAESMFRAAVTIDPKSAEAFKDLAVVQVAQGKRAEALWSARQAVRLDPASAARGLLDGLRSPATTPSVTRPGGTP